MQYVIDLDDFAEDNNGLGMLFRLRAKVPGFRVNLFTIPGRCTQGFLEEVRKLEWIDMIPHGFNHPTSRECEYWTYRQTLDYLDYLEDLGLTRGFKAPGWVVNDATYEALLIRGYWIADQSYNDYRRPEGLRAYILDSPNKIHGHVGHLGGRNANALELIYDDLLKLHGEFMFIKDLW